MPRPATNVLSLLTATRWAMRRENLEQLLAVAERDGGAVLARVAQATEGDGVSIDDDKLRQRRALFSAPATEHPKSARLGVRDGVAIVPIVGPLCRYASWFQDVCGMTSYQLAAMDFRVAVDDPSVRAILLHLDTPGGEVNGCAELAQLIYAARGIKPIVAMVSDGAASAGYWIAAAADEIVVSPAAYVGSIGVWFEIMDASGYEEANGLRRFRIVSSQSPNKVPDPADDAGRQVLQREADQFADAFLEAVATFRGTTTAQLIAAGDGGAVFVGRHAVERGLADRVATTEDVLAELAGASRAEPISAAPVASGRTTTTPESRMKKQKAQSGTRAPRALKSGDTVTSKVTREFKVEEGAALEVVEVLDNVSVIAVKEGDDEKRWLLAEEVDGGTAAAPAESEPATGSDDEVKDEPEAVTAAFPKASASIGATAAVAERERIVGILSLQGSADHPAIVQGCIADPTCTRALAAEQLLGAQPKAGSLPKALEAFLSAERVAAPSASHGTGPTGTGSDRADGILAARALVRGTR